MDPSIYLKLDEFIIEERGNDIQFYSEAFFPEYQKWTILLLGQIH